MLEQVAEDVWVVHQPLKAAGLVPLGTRMSVVRLAGGGLFLHSPARRTPELADAVAALGPVQVITAPNTMHHLFVGEWMAAHPNAISMAAPGLPEKRTDLRFSAIWSATPLPALQGSLEHLCLQGMALHEVVFFHARSRTLIITDLALNFTRGPADTMVQKIYYRLTGAGHGLGQNSIVRMTFKDRALVRDGIDRVLAWDFDRILLAHGDLVLDGGKRKLREATDWLR